MTNYKEHIDIIEKYKLAISNPNITSTSKIELLKQLYQYIKLISPNYYDGKRVDYMYSNINRRLDQIEDYTPKGFIIPSKPVTKEIINPTQNNILDYIIYQTRLRLKDKIESCYGKFVDFSNLSLTNECNYASPIVNEICNNLDIESVSIYINPGFDPSINLMSGSGYHYFNIVVVDEKKYIVDCTYRQFFTIYRNFKERIGLVGTNGAKPGLFMTMTPERIQLAKELTTKGYIPLTRDNLKLYLDGFALSYRNGLYYEQTNDFSYETKYSFEDYINFLVEEDSQILHESKETLGIQKKPLKNPNLHF